MFLINSDFPRNAFFLKVDKRNEELAGHGEDFGF